MRLKRRQPNRSCGCAEHQRDPRTEVGESGRNVLFCQYKRGADFRNLNWNLTIEEFAEITKLPCHYCKVESSLKVKGSKGIRVDHGLYVANGIDRKDNNKGYSKENVLPCCTKCNKAKGTQSYEEFLEWLSLIRRNFTA